MFLSVCLTDFIDNDSDRNGDRDRDRVTVHLKSFTGNPYTKNKIDKIKTITGDMLLLHSL